MGPAHELKQLIRRLTPEAAWVTLKKMRKEYAVRHFPARIEKHTYQGFPLSVHIADSVGQSWYANDWDNLPELDLLAQYRLKPGARVFDLGAHQFVVALMLGKMVGDTGQVIGLEAGQWDSEVGRKNVELNHAGNVTVIHGAIAEHSGEVDFSLNGHVSDSQRKGGRVRVRAYTVDELSQMYGYPDVLFMDIEGYEALALKGAAETLKRKPDCFVEVHVGQGLEIFGGTAKGILDFFPESSFDRFVNRQHGHAFQPLAQDPDALKERFFMIAVPHAQASRDL